VNWLDVVLLAVVLISVVTSFSSGITREVVGLVTLIGALILAIWFYGSAGGFLLPYVSAPSIANFCGFIIVFLGILILGAVLGRLLARLMKVAGLSFVDRLLGAAFGVLRGLLISIALVLAMLAFTPGNSPPAAVVNSKVAPYVIDAARVFAAVAPHELKDAFHKSYGRVKTIWGDALREGTRDLPKT
jgi:membrane protein required for colicin V production